MSYHVNNVIVLLGLAIVLSGCKEDANTVMDREEDANCQGAGKMAHRGAGEKCPRDAMSRRVGSSASTHFEAEGACRWRINSRWPTSNPF